MHRPSDPTHASRAAPRAFTLIELPAARRRGFTLIELLVVVAIIASLIAILLPSMSKAREIARVTVCGTQLQQIGVGLTSYTVTYKGYYPHRAPITGTSYYKPSAITWDTSDIRPMLHGYLSINGLFNCPLSEAVDLEIETDTAVMASYHLFAGFGYHGAGERAMLRHGDPLTWQGQRFRVLAADRMTLVNDWRGDESTHPAPGQSVYGNQSWSYGGLVWTQTGWTGDFDPTGPGVDLNFLFDDGSVRMIGGLTPGDDRVEPVPGFAPGHEYPIISNYLPRH